MTRQELIAEINENYRIAYRMGNRSFLVGIGTGRNKRELIAGAGNMLKAVALRNQIHNLQLAIGEEYGYTVRKYHLRDIGDADVYLFLDPRMAENQCPAYRQQRELSEALSELLNKWWEER